MEKYNIVNKYLLIIIIFLQVLYFLINDSEILKVNIKHVIPLNSVTFYIIIILIILFIATFSISFFIAKILKVSIYLIIAFILITITNYVGFVLNQNVTFIDSDKDLDKLLEESNTGDFLLFSNDSYYDITDVIIFRFLYPLLCSNAKCTHIGMILKIKNETYVVESTDDKLFCMHHKYKKNGPVINKAKHRIKNYKGDVYLSKNNLHMFLNKTHIYNNFKKYENQYFFQNGVWCVTLISNILSDMEIMKRPFINYSPYNFIDPQNYKVDYRQIENIKIRK